MRTIQKVKLKNEKELEVHFLEERENPNDPEGRPLTKKSKIEDESPVHADLVKAFRALRIHFSVISEETPARFSEKDMDINNEKSPYYDDAYIANLTVTQVIFKDKEGSEGVVLCGHKKLKSGKVINMTLPFVKFDPDVTDYPYAEILEEDAQRCLDEAREYLGGKHAPKSQLGLFDDESKTNPVDDNKTKLKANVS